MRFLSAVVMLLLFLSPSAGAQDWAKPLLEKSPRHLDWVTVKAGDREVKCFIAYPERKGKATSVVLIHEIFGLSDWMRSQCDELAEAGFIAIAPDLLSGKDAMDSTKYSGNDALRKAVTSLPPDEVTDDLKVVAQYVRHLPSADGKLAVAGFCWGGAQSFRYATNDPSINAAFVFYGTPPDAEAMKRIAAPVYGFYAEKDARVTSTVDPTIATMNNLGKHYQTRVYREAGHGFMRTGEAPDAKAPDKDARAKAWTRFTELLGRL